MKQTRLDEQSITVEANSLAEARALAADRLRQDAAQVAGSHHEEVLSPGGEHHAQHSDSSVELATNRARKALPPRATLISVRTLSEPTSEVVEVEAADETSAKRLAANRAASGFLVLKVETIKPAKTGVLGIGAKNGRFNVFLLRHATVELAYHMPARIRVSWLEREEVEVSDPPANDKPTVSARLKLRYGLSALPNHAQIKAWAEATRFAARKGSEIEYAARSAAFMMFKASESQFASKDSLLQAAHKDLRSSPSTSSDSAESLLRAAEQE